MVEKSGAALQKLIARGSTGCHLHLKDFMRVINLELWSQCKLHAQAVRQVEGTRVPVLEIYEAVAEKWLAHEKTERSQLLHKRAKRKRSKT